jgi:hypothetical protein
VCVRVAIALRLRDALRSVTSMLHSMRLLGEREYDCRLAKATALRIEPMSYPWNSLSSGQCILLSPSTMLLFPFRSLELAVTCAMYKTIIRLEMMITSYCILVMQCDPKKETNAIYYHNMNSFFYDCLIKLNFTDCRHSTNYSRLKENTNTCQ